MKLNIQINAVCLIINVGNIVTLTLRYIIFHYLASIHGVTAGALKFTRGPVQMGPAYTDIFHLN